MLRERPLDGVFVLFVVVSVAMGADLRWVDPVAETRNHASIAGAVASDRNPPNRK
jgi:hypothetical protein